MSISNIRHQLNKIIIETQISKKIEKLCMIKPHNQNQCQIASSNSTTNKDGYNELSQWIANFSDRINRYLINFDHSISEDQKTIIKERLTKIIDVLLMAVNCGCQAQLESVVGLRICVDYDNKENSQWKNIVLTYQSILGVIKQLDKQDSLEQGQMRAKYKNRRQKIMKQSSTQLIQLRKSILDYTNKQKDEQNIAITRTSNQDQTPIGNQDRCNKKQIGLNKKDTRESIKQKWAQTANERKDSCLSSQQVSRINMELEQSIRSNCLKQGHFSRQLIKFNTHLDPQVFPQCQPLAQRLFLTQTCHSIPQISPLKISSINSHSEKATKIKIKNYFNSEIEYEKITLHYCKPGTRTLYLFYLHDIDNAVNITNQYVNQVELPVTWNFGKFVKTVVTTDGVIYGVNCRTTADKLDPSLYQISTNKVSNRGKVPHINRESSLVYCNNFLYLIGGLQLHADSCSSACSKYSLKSHKWITISSSHTTTKNSTVCTFSNRYILKLGGLNEFNFLNKTIQLYDTLNDRWSIVQTCLKNVQEQTPILEGSSAVQINDKQIFIFGGKNVNGYAADNSIVLEITQIRQQIKADSKVSAEIRSCDTRRRNILSFSGTYSSSNPIIFNNSLYTVRSAYAQSPLQ